MEHFQLCIHLHIKGFDAVVVFILIYRTALVERLKGAHIMSESFYTVS